MNIRKHFVTIAAIALMAASLTVSIASAASLGDRSLKAGATGDDVRQLQTALTREGLYEGTVDGIYGQKTRQAVVNLQQLKQLEIDGIAGNQTVAALASTGAAVSRGDAPGRFKQVIDIVATAYAPGPHDNGKWGNLTHIGTNVRPGIIAVDPKVIPLRSRVYIEFADGHGMYATAEDTGGAIKGKRIDIAMWTVAEAYQFGMQKVKVYVLE